MASFFYTLYVHYSVLFHFFIIDISNEVLPNFNLQPLKKVLLILSQYPTEYFPTHRYAGQLVQIHATPHMILSVYTVVSNRSHSNKKHESLNITAMFSVSVSRICNRNHSVYWACKKQKLTCTAH